MTGSTPRTAARRWDPARIAFWIVVPLAAATILSVSASFAAAAMGVPVVLALVLGLVLAASLVLAPVRPVAAVVVSTAAVLGFALAVQPVGPWPIMVTSTITQALVVLLVARTRWLAGALAVIIGGLGGTTIALASPFGRTSGAGPAATADLIVFVSVTAVAWLIGLLIGRWSEVRAQLTRERAVTAAEFTRRQAIEERTRLARELHDVVAHGMSAIQVQASSARYRLHDLPDDAAAEFDEIAALARTSMAEMRSLLTVLRGESTRAETLPQPTAAQLPALIASATHGARVVFDQRMPAADLASLDPVVSLTVYRVVQESLSNVARHATGARTHVTLERAANTLIIDVRNAAPASTPGAADATDATDATDDAAGSASAAAITGPPWETDAGGNGIRGMRERVTALRGTLEAGPTPDGGFAVRASIPLTTPAPLTPQTPQTPPAPHDDAREEKA